LGWHDDLPAQDGQLAVAVGPTRVPHWPLIVPPSIGEDAPQTSPRGTQTLAWLPATSVAGMQVSSLLHSLPLGQVETQ
jgi:hypothetical protein